MSAPDMMTLVGSLRAPSSALGPTSYRNAASLQGCKAIEIASRASLQIHGIVLQIFNMDSIRSAEHYTRLMQKIMGLYQGSVSVQSFVEYPHTRH